MISPLSSSGSGSQLTPSHPIRHQSVSSMQALGLPQDSFSPRFQGNGAQSAKKPHWFSRTVHSPYTKLVSGGLLLAGGIAIKLLGLATVLGAPVLLPIGLGVAAAGVGLMGWGGFQAFGKKKDANEPGEAVSQESPVTDTDSSSRSVVSDEPPGNQHAPVVNNNAQLVPDSSIVSDDGVKSEPAAKTQSQPKSANSANDSQAAGSGLAVDLSTVPSNSQQRQIDQAGTATPNVSAASRYPQKHVTFAPLPKKNPSAIRSRPVNRDASPRQAHGTNGNVGRNTANVKTPTKTPSRSPVSSKDAAQKGSLEKRALHFFAQAKRTFGGIGRDVANYFEEGLGRDPVSRARSQARMDRHPTNSHRGAGYGTETRFNNESHYY